MTDNNSGSQNPRRLYRTRKVAAYAVAGLVVTGALVKGIKAAVGSNKTPQA